MRSVWAVELLLLLRRDPERCWPPEALVAELRASTNLVQDNLKRLETSGLVVCDDDGCWRYAAAGPVLDELAGRLEAAYRERPVAIINLIARPPDPIQGLADAFKWRGDK
jgi:predicted transcriptional regulator